MITTGQRLALSVALAVVLVSALGMGLAYTLVARDLTARQTALVAADLAGFAALYDQRRIPAVRQAIEFRLAQADDGLAIALWDGDAQLAGNLDAVPSDLSQPAEGATGPVTAISLQGRDHLAARAHLRGGFTLVVARDTAPVAGTLSAMRRILLGALAGAAVLALLAGHLVSRLILDRLARINRLADAVAAGDLSARIPTPPAADEFGTLQTHVHAMLDRIEALNEATTYLSDSVAHEMRTPLTRIQARLADLDAPAAQTDALAEDIRATIRIFDAMLDIARAEADRGDTRDLSRLDLSGLLAEIHELYEPSADAQDLTFTAEIAPNVTVLGDRNLIAQLASNLVENALKFTPAGERVHLTLTRAGQTPTLTVRDTGPGIPSGFEHRLFDRFTRSPLTQAAPGSGLGLALVHAIAMRHGAKVSVPSVERGFAIAIAWPSVPPEDGEPVGQRDV